MANEFKAKNGVITPAVKIAGASNTVTIQPSASAGTTTYTLPAADGTTGQVLSTNGSGTLSWAAGGTAGGSAAIIYVIDGGESAITTGIKGDLYIPFGCTIVEWTLLADQSGSIVIDIWKDSYANYPATVADTITGSAKPTITSATKAQSSTLTGWTTSISAGQSLRFNVDSAATIQRITLALKVNKT